MEEEMERNDLPAETEKSAPAWYHDINLEHAEKFISENLKAAARNVIAIGYYLKYIRDNKLYEESGYQNIWDYAREKYGFSTSTASRYMSRNDKFSKGGNSPIMDERYREYGKSQLQEMLSLDEEQLQQVTSDMTAREIRDLRRPKKTGVVSAPVDVPEPEQSENDSFSLEDIKPQKKSESVATSQKMEEKSGNQKDDGCPDGITCCPRNEWGTTPEEQETGRKECRKCWEQYEKTSEYSGWQQGKQAEAEDVRMEEAENEEEQTQENRLRWNTENEYETRKKYCDAAARKFINSFHDWMLEDYENRVLNVTQSEKEFKQEFRKSGICSWHFKDPEDEIKVAKVNLFDGYIQFWNGDGICIGNCDWFYLCASVQSMWNVIYLEAAEKEKEELQSGTEDEVIDTEFTESEEEALSDLDLLKDILKSKNNLLDSCLRIDGMEEASVHIRKMKLEVAALASMLCDLENAPEALEEPEQPELPTFKNNDERKSWLNDYAAWGLWYEDEHIGARYYKYDFPDGTRLIVDEYRDTLPNGRVYKASYLHLVGGPKERPRTTYGAPKWPYHDRYSKYPDNMTDMVEFLKDLQKRRSC